ncbi:MAG: hypothetical protein M3O28_05060 [Actinomycetota bacterium]|nr:hypothetical protein [Actinomycetota bacterium]
MLIVNLSSIGTSVTLFVSEPDGTVIAAPTVAVSVVGPTPLTPIIVNDPKFGSYEVGLYAHTSNGLVMPLQATLQCTVTATRDDRTVSLAPQTITQQAVVGNDTEAASPFVYGTSFP